MNPTATDPTLWRQVTLPASVKHLRAQLDEPQWQDLPPPGLAVELHGVGLARGGHSVLRDLHLHVAPGEFVAVVGRSGTGKSHLLRLIAGLDQPLSGKLTLDGAPPAQHRHALRLVFQHTRLLPWKRVIDNVALGLPPAAARAMALDALAQVGMADHARDWPTGLSRGQRQRVALARALVHRPRLLLMDEPLGALDAPTRHAGQALIEALWLQHRFTAVLVTHDLDEAVALGDRVVLLESGRVALNERQRLARPRRHDDPAFAAAVHALRHRVLHGA